MKYYRYKMNMTTMNIVAIIFTIFLIFLYFLLFQNGLDISIREIVYIVLWMFLHEIIHGIAFMSFKEVKKRNVVFGAKLESGIFYCMCKQPISKKAILVSLLSPFFFIGIVTLTFALVFDLLLLGFLSIFNISGATGDLLMTIMFLRLPKDIKYMDLDDCEGFVVLSKEDLSKNKYLGLKLFSYGEYTDDIRPHDFKKITCSKLSLGIFVSIIVLFILSFIW